MDRFKNIGSITFEFFVDFVMFMNVFVHFCFVLFSNFLAKFLIGLFLLMSVLVNCALQEICSYENLKLC